ncbi:hypothetical protein FRX31_004097 [Thalictrum thalictroides]|uniref:Uncharacterized protein n=1 Tax=Thalictrum thalictroides TaxID=46969 RepID=A0A7J6XBV2_THATH|nr:hypothetical protein FRX31_004097 [Thalictrum thalictroides]
MALVSSGTSVEIQVLEQNHQLKVVDQEEPTKIGDTTTYNEEIPIPEQKHLTEDIKEARVDSYGESTTQSQKKLKLEKKTSLRTKTLKLEKVDNEITTGIKQSADVKHGASVISRSTLARNSTDEKQPEGWAKLRETVRGKVMGSKKPQANAKDGGETKLNKLKKNSTSKASPLPSFYHRKDTPPKPQPNKVPVTHPRSPQLGQQNKSSSEGVNTNKEDLKKNASRTISVTAKETIHKLFKGVRKAQSSQQEKVLKNSSSISHKSAMEEEKV